MNELDNIIDVTNDTFQARVLEQSQRVPVLVDYWADWCGPCQMQMPVLRKLVEAYAGKFILAKVNTDEQRELARDHGIRSLPTMRLYKGGEMAEEILGAQTESTLRILLDKFIERESDTLRRQAMETYQRGEHEAALRMLSEARASEPENHQLTLEYATLCLQQGRLQEVDELLNALPHDIRGEPEALQLRALLDFATSVQDAPPLNVLEETLAGNPNDLEARYLLGASHVLNDRMEEALEAFMAILERDREFRDDLGRKSLLAVFELLGNQGELVNNYRRRLFTAMH